MKKKTPVAYKIVTDDYEGHAEILFFKTREQARHYAASTTGQDYKDVRVERAREFDNVEDLTDKAYIDRGWWQECHGCFNKVSADMDSEYEDDEGNEVQCDGPLYDQYENCYCSGKCREEHLVKRERIRNAKITAIHWLGIAIPCITNVKATNGGYGQCGQDCFNKNRENIFVEFEIPGVDYSEVYGVEVYCAGCGSFYGPPQSKELIAAYRNKLIDWSVAHTPTPTIYYRDIFRRDDD